MATGVTHSPAPAAVRPPWHRDFTDHRVPTGLRFTFWRLRGSGCVSARKPAEKAKESGLQPEPDRPVVLRQVRHGWTRSQLFWDLTRSNKHRDTRRPRNELQCWSENTWTTFKDGPHPDQRTFSSSAVVSSKICSTVETGWKVAGFRMRPSLPAGAALTTFLTPKTPSHSGRNRDATEGEKKGTWQLT